MIWKRKKTIPGASTYIMKFSNIIVFITFGTQIVYFVTIFVFCLKKFINLLYIIPVHAFHSRCRKTHRYYILSNVCVRACVFHFEPSRASISWRGRKLSLCFIFCCYSSNGNWVHWVLYDGRCPGNENEREREMERAIELVNSWAVDVEYELVQVSCNTVTVSVIVASSSDSKLKMDWKKGKRNEKK